MAEQAILTNKIGLVEKYSEKGYIKCYRSQARISLLEDDSFKVEWIGARTVRIPEVQIGLLKNYTRNNEELGATDAMEKGYKASRTAVRWVPYTLRYDRGAKYVIDDLDDEESLGNAVAAAVGESSRIAIIPEMDAAGFSAIADAVKNANGGNYVSGSLPTVTVNGASVPAPYKAFTDGELFLENHEVDKGDLIAFCSPSYLNSLRNSQEVTKVLLTNAEKKTVFYTTSDGQKKGVELAFGVAYIDDIPLVSVPPKRFKTDFQIGADEGWTFGAGSEDIDFILMDKRAARPITKYQKVRILRGEAALANTDQDSVVVFAHIYYDTKVMNQLISGIYVHTSAFTAVAVTELFAGFDANGVCTALMTEPAGVYSKVYLTAAAQTVGSAISAETLALATTKKVEIGNTCFSASGTYYLCIVDQSNIVRLSKVLTVTGSAGAFAVTITDVGD